MSFFSFFSFFAFFSSISGSSPMVESLLHAAGGCPIAVSHKRCQKQQHPKATLARRQVASSLCPPASPRQSMKEPSRLLSLRKPHVLQSAGSFGLGGQSWRERVDGKIIQSRVSWLNRRML